MKVRYYNGEETIKVMYIFGNLNSNFINYKNILKIDYYEDGKKHKVENYI